MKKEIIQHIVSHLENKGLFSTTEDELVEKLYKNGDERREIIKALMSLFSEEFRADLLRADSLDDELAHKMYELQFVTEDNRLLFVLGKCSKKEQQAVYEKMFKALHFVLIAQEHKEHQFSSVSVTENLFKQGVRLSANKLRQLPRKNFNLEQARQNLEKARKTLAEVSQSTDSHVLEQKLNINEQEETKLKELFGTVDSFRRMMEGRVPLASTCPKETQTVVPELGSAVGELHSVLQFVADVTKPLPSDRNETKNKVDLEQMLKQANHLEDNLVLSKCFEKTLEL